MANNCEFKLSVGQMKDIYSALKLTKKEKYIKFTVEKVGNITCSMDDLGIVSCIVVPTMEIKMEDYKVEFFLDKDVFKKVTDNTQDMTSITVIDGSISFNIDGTEINRSLPVYDIPIDISYTVSTTEMKTSEWVSDTMDKLAVATSGSGVLTPVIALGESCQYGTSGFICQTKQGFDELDVNVIPEFFPYLRNIANFGGKVDFITDETNEDQTWFIVKSDNVFYKVKTAQIEFPDVSSLIEEQEDILKVNLPKDPLLTSLNKLTIPLYGAKETICYINFDKKDDNVQAQVKDVSNKISKDDWIFASLTASGNAQINIYDLLNAISDLKEDFNFSLYETLTILEDESVRIILANYYDEDED